MLETEYGLSAILAGTQHVEEKETVMATGSVPEIGTSCENKIHPLPQPGMPNWQSLGSVPLKGNISSPKSHLMVPLPQTMT